MEVPGAAAGTAVAGVGTGALASWGVAVLAAVGVEPTGWGPFEVPAAALP